MKFFLILLLIIPCVYGIIVAPCELNFKEPEKELFIENTLSVGANYTINFDEKILEISPKEFFLKSSERKKLKIKAKERDFETKIEIVEKFGIGNFSTENLVNIRASRRLKNKFPLRWIFLFSFLILLSFGKRFINRISVLKRRDGRKTRKTPGNQGLKSLF